MGRFSNLTSVIHDGLSLVALVIVLGGLFVCVSNWRLSNSMWLVTLGFAGWLGASGLSFAGSMLIKFGFEYGTIISGVFLVARLIGIIADLLIVLGLAAVFRDLRERLTMFEHMTRR